MSRADTATLIERCLAAFNASDHAALLDCVSEDVALDTGPGRREIGKERLRWLMAFGTRHFRASVSDIVVMTDDVGGRAAAEFTLRGSYAETTEGLPAANGQSFSVQTGIFVEVDDGLVTRLSTHFDRTGFAALLARR